MTALRKIGFFYELPLQQRIETLRSTAQTVAHPDEGKIVSYLEAGTAFAAVPLVEEDVLTDPPQMIGPPHTQTDGAWAWPQTLPYYIRRYHIALPEEFLAQMRLRDWKPSAHLDVSQLGLEGEVSIG